MSTSELSSESNGIWLCGVHAKAVDNNGGAAYSPETLLSYKALHEARVSLEHEGLYPPIGWLHELEVVRGPLFASPQTVQLAKLNLVYGPNVTGKTALAEWIAGFFDRNSLARWEDYSHEPLEVRLSLLNPKLQKLQFVCDENGTKYSIDGKSAAFVPIGFNVFRPLCPDFSIGDDLEMLARALKIKKKTVRSLLNEVNGFEHAEISNLRFESNEDGSNTFRCDLNGTAPGLELRSLSRREVERVIIELATAAARLSGKYCPTLLILDEVPSLIFDGFFEFYSRHFLAPENQFQTVMCLPTQSLNLDAVVWNGWQVIRTEGRVPSVKINQRVRRATD
ncbi:hypothetical protein G3N96_05930 [Burkholderia sp. Se-20373]|uniref:hypothetical protein n=1 Tax=Burkholderia sp. Se-20373 TaxID=2703898 RepID=UPI00197EB419|nr:hypothetical protein [Burkholderia sp. Se-20373]MBN3744977.1 hypothetical protein [Burkholderia sp. Se-20373]